jgi:hypothetical protein
MTTATAAKVCVDCGRGHGQTTRRCYACRGARRGPRACTACGGPTRQDRRKCHGCSRAGRCRVCNAPHPGRGTCGGCLADLARWRDLIGGREPERPPSFSWPAGHIERLAERAAAGLPLFG